MKTNAAKIAVVGPGSIGLLFAALLSRCGHDLFLLDHNPQRAVRRNSDGIFIHQNSDKHHTELRSSANARDFGRADLVFICTKAYDTAAAAKSLPLLTDSNTIAVSLQNGLGNAEKIFDATKTDRILCASTAMAAYIENSNTIRHTGRGSTQLAQFGNTPINHAQKTAQVLNDAGCPATVADDARSMLWSKLIINAAINPVTALFSITNGEMLNHAAAADTAYKAAAEAKEVADAMGITLRYEDVTAAINKTCKETAENRSSMLRDIETHRQTEIDSITGAIIAEADRLNIEVPVNRKLLQAIQAINTKSE